MMTMKMMVGGSGGEGGEGGGGVGSRIIQVAHSSLEALLLLLSLSLFPFLSFPFYPFFPSFFLFHTQRNTGNSLVRQIPYRACLPKLFTTVLFFEPFSRPTTYDIPAHPWLLYHRNVN